MSGGSLGYLCYEIEEKVVGEMGDLELDEMMRDVAKLLHDLEWWRSGDYDEDAYRKTAAKFKARWLAGGKGRSKRLKLIMDEQFYQLRKELMRMLGEEEENG